MIVKFKYHDAFVIRLLFWRFFKMFFLGQEEDFEEDWTDEEDEDWPEDEDEDWPEDDEDFEEEDEW